MDEALNQDAELQALAEGAGEDIATPENDPGTEIHVKEPQAFELNYRGKLEKHPLEKILQFAQQGRDYNEKMRLFRDQRSSFEKSLRSNWEKETEPLHAQLKEFREVSEYIKKDPAWWDHVRTNYQSRLKEQGQQASLPPEIASKIEKLEAFVTSAEQRQAQEQEAKEDSELDGIISAFKEEHPDLDWKTLDDQGTDLERRILNHASDMGITTAKGFRAAARDLLHDDLLGRAKLSGKEDVGKQIQKATKLGLGPITDKPTVKQLGRVKSVRDKSWEDIERELVEKEGIAS